MILFALAWLIPGFEKRARIAFSYGCSISALLSLSGFLILLKSAASSAKKFIRVLLGGMIIRLFLALAAIALGIGVLGLPTGALVGSCLTSYVIFTILEHVYLLPLLSNRV